MLFSKKEDIPGVVSYNMYMYEKNSTHLTMVNIAKYGISNNNKWLPMYLVSIRIPMATELLLAQVSTMFIAHDPRSIPKLEGA